MENASSPVLKHRNFWGYLIAILALVSAISFALTPDFNAIARSATSPQMELSQTQDGDRRVNATVAYNIKDPNDERTALYVPKFGGTLRISVNGSPLAETASNKLAGLDRNQNSRFFEVPPQFLKAGTNEIVVTQSNNMQGFGLLPIYVGDATSIGRVKDQHNNIIRGTRAALVLALSASMAFTVLLIFFSRSPMRYIFLLLDIGILVILNRERNLFLFGIPFTSFTYYTLIAYFTSSFLTIGYWTGLERPHLKRGLQFCGGLLMILILIDAVFGASSAFAKNMHLIILVIGVALTAIFNIVQLIRSFYSSSNEYRLIAMALMIATLALVLSAWFYYFHGGVALHLWAVATSNLAAAFSSLMLSFVALYFEVRYYRTSLQTNRTLESVVAGHTLALDRQGTALKIEIERRAALEERHRITRDMHDGIGGQLLSLLIKARRGDVPNAEIERDISKSLNDLRLMSASLDGSDDGLLVSLRTLRERLQDQLDAANLKLNWVEAEDLVDAHLGPRETLSLLRIVQEAVTNVIHHAGASAVDIEITVNKVAGRLCVKVADDGKGFDISATSRVGTGIRNMKSRAAQIEGEMSFGRRPDKPGTLIEAMVPCQITDAVTTPFNQTS